jgi:hypothetical protein
MIVAGKRLIPGQRYTFYIQDNSRNVRHPPFRANAIDVLENGHGSTLRVDHYGDEIDGMSKYPDSIYTFPLTWIGSVETIDDVTEHKCVLPEEIMLTIDGFMP